MSTATEIMLRAQETQRRMDQALERWNPVWLAKWQAIGMWHLDLIRIANATRFQLGWNGQWAGRTLNSWTLKQWARAVDLLYRDTELPPATYAGAMRAWSDWRGQMDDEPPGAHATVVGTWRWSFGGKCIERPATLSHQPSMRAQEWAYAIRDALRRKKLERIAYEPTPSGHQPETEGP